jgi:hypothetical protein
VLERRLDSVQPGRSALQRRFDSFHFFDGTGFFDDIGAGS